MKASYNDVSSLLRAECPEEPVYCIYPEVYKRTTKRFLNGFPGRVLYAIKANNHADVVRLLCDAGVCHFDCASLPEIEFARRLCPEATLYYMNPVRLTDHAKVAQRDHGVRHFMVDHLSGVGPLSKEIDPTTSIIFARMAVSHESAMEDLSSKFGARPDDVPELLTAIAATGAEPALAFNVGSGVIDPDAYALALGIAGDVLRRLSFKVRLLDIGGGFPVSYPGFEVPEIDEFFARTKQAIMDVPLAEGGELMAEPGRALCAPGLSAVTRVLLRKPDRLYLNDGMYGVFWELRFNGHKQYPNAVFRNGERLHGPTKAFRVFGPTCDSSDELPERIELPATIDVGDHIEFGRIGAYSLSGRTNFNGFFSDTVVRITDHGGPCIGK